MKTNLTLAHLVFVLAFIATIIGFAAFSQLPANKNPVLKDSSTGSDTSAVKEQRNEENERLNQINIELKQLDLKLDRLSEELKHVDLSRAEKEIQRAVRQLKTNKLSKLADKELKVESWKRQNRQTEERIAHLDAIDMNEVKRELEKVKAEIRINRSELNVRTPDIDTRKIRAQVADAMKNVRKSIAGAGVDSKNWRELINMLGRDGLIDRSKPYKIEVKNQRLYINGKKQSKKISDRYKSFYKNDRVTLDIHSESDGWI